MSEKVLDVFFWFMNVTYMPLSCHLLRLISYKNIHIIYIHMQTESCALRDEELMTIIQCKRQITLSGFLWYACFWKECQEIYEMKNNLIIISHGIL